MRPLEYVRADDPAAAVALVSADPDAEYLAGGTTELDLVLKDGVHEPARLVDITRLPLRGIGCEQDTLRVGALTTMEELAADPTVGERLPFVREALLAGASPQLRNMATIGGNILGQTARDRPSAPSPRGSPKSASTRTWEWCASRGSSPPSTPAASSTRSWRAARSSAAA